MITIFNDITQNLIPINWMNQSDFSQHPNLTQHLKSWLYEKSLLTTRLKQCAKNFQLKVLKETYGKQSSLLSDMPITNNNYIREVMMLSDNEPCILGQTTIPEQTLKHNNWVENLGTMGLGEAITNLPNVSRSEFNFSFCVNNNPVLRKYGLNFSDKEGVKLWIRRSSFFIESRPLWVVEIFLPKIYEL